MFKTQLIGNLGQDAKANTVNGKNVINFSVAHTKKYKDASGTQRESTTWVECSWWIDSTKIVPYLRKGTMVYVEGEPSLDSYKNGRGETVPVLRLRVDALKLLQQANGQGRQDQQQQQGQAPYSDADANDDLPF